MVTLRALRVLKAAGVVARVSAFKVELMKTRSTVIRRPHDRPRGQRKILFHERLPAGRPQG